MKTTNSFAVSCLSLITYLSSLISINAQNVAINTHGSLPDPSAILDVSDTAKGMLIPRLSTGQMNRISSPATGLLLYNTSTNCLMMFTGSLWQVISCACTGAPSTPGIISGNTTVCTSSAGNVYSIAAVSGAINYTWSVPTGATITSGAGTTSITVTYSSASGNITVTASNSCGTSVGATLAVALTSIPSTPAVPSGSATPTVGTASTYTIAPVSGATGYLWSVSSTNGSVTSGQGTTSATITFGGNQATMNICVYDSNVCGSSAAACLSVTTQTCSHGSVTFNYTGSIVSWNVPSGCNNSLTITASGAQGGTEASVAGGLGAQVQGTFSVTAGSVLQILAGEEGGTAGSGSAGGGGGSFVALGANYSTATPLIVAGGGGGSFNSINGSPGLTGTSGGGYSPGTGGNGGGVLPGTTGGGGGGFYTDGTNGSYGNGGSAFVNGGAGSPSGGFGGGGGQTNNGSNVAGGGGGYSGGSGGGIGSPQNAAGGGGSYILPAATNQSSSSGVQSGNGVVIIQY